MSSLWPKTKTDAVSWFVPLVIAGMAGCVAISVVELAQFLAPQWRLGAYVVVCCVLAALEATYSYRLTRQRELRGTRLLRFRAVELLAILLIVRAAAFIGDPWPEILAEVNRWPTAPADALSSETVAVFILVVLVWWTATATAHHLERLQEPPELRRGETHPTRSITARFFWGGVFLMVVAGLARIGIALLLKMPLPRVPRLVLNVLVYFLLGLALLGQAHWINLRERWRAHRVRVPPGLAARWVRLSLALVGLAALIAFLLPTDYTIGFLDLVMQIVGIVIYALTILFLIVSYLLGALMHLLLSLFGVAPRVRRLPLRLPPLRWPLITRPPPASLPGWLETLRSVFFWAVAIAMIVYVVRTYLRDHPEILRALARLPLARALARLFAGLWRRLVGAARQVRSRMQSAAGRRHAAAAAPPAGLRRPAPDSVRDHVLFYYLSMLERARRLGVGRRATQTPLEYEATLAQYLRSRGEPAAEEDVAALTEAFDEARFSLHPLAASRGQQARLSWQRLKAVLRGLQRRGP